MYDYTKSLERSRRSRSGTTTPRRFVLDGREWIVLPGVFSPADTKSTAAHLALLQFAPGGSFLEIGCGTGVIAVSAALGGSRRVIAVDINPEAVANAAANAALFGVDNVVHTLHSDLFDGLPPGSRFDTIYWHSNNAWAPRDLAVDLHERAYVDPGYAAHDRFLANAPEYLAPGGHILIGVSSRAERPMLDELAGRNGLRFMSVAAATVEEPEGPTTYELLEAMKATSDVCLQELT